MSGEALRVDILWVEGAALDFEGYLSGGFGYFPSSAIAEGERQGESCVGACLLDGTLELVFEGLWQSTIADYA